MAAYQMKLGKLRQKVINAYEGVEKKFTETFLEPDENSESGYRLKTAKTAEAVTNAYKKMEHSVTTAYQKIEDRFVDAFLENREEEGDEK